MPNTSLAIKLQPAERTQLEKWGSAHGTPQQVALRCRIILGALAGQDNVSIAEQLGVSRRERAVVAQAVSREHGEPIVAIAQSQAAFESHL